MDGLEIASDDEMDGWDFGSIEEFKERIDTISLDTHNLREILMSDRDLSTKESIVSMLQIICAQHCALHFVLLLMEDKTYELFSKSDTLTAIDIVDEAWSAENQEFFPHLNKLVEAWKDDSGSLVHAEVAMSTLTKMKARTEEIEAAKSRRREAWLAAIKLEIATLEAKIAKLTGQIH